MSEIVVISGKGGTGKTTVTATLAALTSDLVVADCDVDAANLHLLLCPEVERRETFRSGHLAVIRQEDCVACGACLAHCRYHAVQMDGEAAGEATFSIDPLACEGCGVCVARCPLQAIDFPECECGEWYVSASRCGPLVHARLDVGADNSGKLVALVRQQARALAAERGLGRRLVDGPPGIGCPVIAAVTGADRLLVVAEPSVAARHDLGRTLDLAAHFGVPASLCLNKWDLHPAMADQIESEAAARGVECLARLPYDPAVTTAQREARLLTEGPRTPVLTAIEQLQERLWES